MGSDSVGRALLFRPGVLHSVLEIVTVDAMRLWWVPLVAILATSACGGSRNGEARPYELKGQILAVWPERSEVVIKHEDIKGFMPGMTMPVKVKDLALLDGKQPGDLVTATLVVGEVNAHLSTLTKTGHAAPEAPPPPAADVRQPGEALTDATLVNEDGTPTPFSAFRGHRVAMTFIYT